MTAGYLVFGATGSIGSELCRQLRQQGSHVYLAGRNADRLRELGAELDCPATPVDAADPTTMERAIEAAASALGTLDGIANCIGSVLLKPAHTTSWEEWHTTLQTNLGSAFAVVRGGSAAMRGAGGSIVLVSSAAARIGIANHEAIAAAKAGILGLVRSAAATYADRNLRINAVAPGLVKSHMTRRLWEAESAANASRQMHVLGRLGEPGEVARLMAWLLDPMNSWITGQVFGIDGGLGSVVPRPRVRV